MDDLLVFLANGIYVAMGLTAMFGLFWVILLLYRVRQKRFASAASADQFLDDIRDHLAQKDLNAVADLCDSPTLLEQSRAPIGVGGRPKHGPPHEQTPAKLLAEKFERDILASLEYGTSWIATVVKSAPMLGLLGTVLGMINAFAKIASSTGGTDPTKLANDISFALLTTALGLIIAIPLVMAGNLVQIRIGKLQDAVQHDLGVFLEDVEDTRAAGGATA